jgi:SOS response regulatory protein OraA/RecX
MTGSVRSPGVSKWNTSAIYPSHLASLLPSLYPSFVRPRSKPRELATEQELYTSALRALMRRAHSIHEMRVYLERRTQDKDAVSQVVARLRELSYLDDGRYALEFARQHANSRRQGRFRITRELRARGVPDRYIDSALQAVFAETGEAELVRARLKRRLSHVRGVLGQRQIAGIYRSLLRAGFAADVIRAELRGVTHGDLPEVPDVADEPELTGEGDAADGPRRPF